MLTDVDKTINAIYSMKAAGKFEPYIQGISFPHFKNLDRGLSIEFGFPVTALIGQNGTNKSSILRALQACPEENSISDYWFDTDLDHIENEPNDRQRYIHRYKVPSGAMAEVIKIRIQKEDRGWDYFETAKPRITDGMRKMPAQNEEDEPYRAGTRWRPIKKDVVYIDFRAQLPAFDILMSYQNRKSKRDSAQRKSLVRLRARRLDEAIRHAGQKPVNSITVCGTERLLSDVIVLSDAELEDVGLILGRKYKSIKLVKHDLYDYEGWTAKLISEGLDYSEAFAGSGEFAAISIVHELYSANERSLILLDEPETSLHPGAQTALCHFLLKMCKQKCFQIVMATHSRDLIRDLPSEGRKLLGILPGNSHISIVSESASLEESFLRLGADFEHDVVYVEDGLAAELLNVAFRKKGSDAIGSVTVKQIPGGAQTIKRKVVPILATLDSKAMVVLDGDQRVELDFSEHELNEEQCLFLLGKFGIKKKDIPLNGGDGNNIGHVLKQMNKVLRWIKNHVRYLPGRDPEGLLLSVVDCVPIEEMEDSSSAENKKTWCERAKAAYSKCDSEVITSEEIFSYQKMMLADAFGNSGNDVAAEVIQKVSEIAAELLC